MPTPTTFLQSFVTYLKATSSVTSLLATPNSIYLDMSQWQQDVPFILITNYTEILPGVTPDDASLKLRLTLYAHNMTVCSLLYLQLINAIDTTTINPNSIRTTRFAWSEGNETGMMRDSTGAMRLAGLGRGGQFVYEMSIDYQFWFNPLPALS